MRIRKIQHAGNRCDDRKSPALCEPTPSPGAFRRQGGSERWRNSQSNRLIGSDLSAVAQQSDLDLSDEPNCCRVALVKLETRTTTQQSGSSLCARSPLAERVAIVPHTCRRARGSPGLSLSLSPSRPVLSVVNFHRLSSLCLPQLSGE